MASILPCIALVDIAFGFAQARGVQRAFSPLPRSSLLLLLLAASALLACNKRSKESAWIAPTIGPLSVQDINGDGYDDCVVWMGKSPDQSLHVIDGKSGGHRHGFRSDDGRTAALSGNHLAFATYDFEWRYESSSKGESYLALAGLRTGQLVARGPLPGGSPELYTVGQGFVAHFVSADFLIDVGQSKIYPTGAMYRARARLVGERVAPTDEDQWKIEQALSGLGGWTQPMAEAAARRAVGTASSWVVPRDRNYGRLTVLDRATRSRSWSVDLGEGEIVHLAAGDDLIGAVLHAEAQDKDVLVLVDIASQRATFRYQATK